MHFQVLKPLRPAGLFSALRRRCYSQPVTVHPSILSTTGVSCITKVKHPYFVPRNSRGSLPVYTDIRNGGSRYLVLVKNVQGNVSALRDDLAGSLFKNDSGEAARLKIAIIRDHTLVLTGGRWKHQVMDWMRLRGF